MIKKTRLRVQQWGDSLAVRLPTEIVRAAALEPGLEIEIAVCGNRIDFIPVASDQPTLAQRLERFDPRLHRGEAMTVLPVGAEVA